MTSPSERIIALYEENAAAWDSQRGRDLFERPWMERFASNIADGGSILDIGCGMGEPIARFFIDAGFEVTGVDSSPSLIALCGERFYGQTWLVRDMRSLALDKRFDGLVAWHSLFHLTPEDQRAMFSRFARHLRPSGMLMFTSGPSASEMLNRWCGEPLYEASLARDEYVELLRTNGFMLVEHAVRDPECGHATIWLARYEPMSEVA